MKEKDLRMGKGYRHRVKILFSPWVQPLLQTSLITIFSLWFKTRDKFWSLFIDFFLFFIFPSASITPRKWIGNADQRIWRIERFLWWQTFQGKSLYTVFTYYLKTFLFWVESNIFILISSLDKSCLASSSLCHEYTAHNLGWKAMVFGNIVTFIYFKSVLLPLPFIWLLLHEKYVPIRHFRTDRTVFH